jgi:zinc transport system permease protein
MIEAFHYHFIQNALMAGLLASIACGIIGSYIVVQRIVFIGGGISHAAYGGVGIAYFFGFDPLLGATGFSTVSALIIGIVSRRTHQHADTIIGIIWAFGMAIGILFVSLTPGAKPDLMSYLFGNILMVTTSDVILMAILNGVILIIVILLYKEFLLISFDEEFATVRGLHVEVLHFLQLLLIALTVVLLIRVVGIILVIALLTIPPATSRLFVDKLSHKMILSVILGMIYAVSGLALSYTLGASYGVNMPSGPIIIILASLVYVLSIGTRGLYQKYLEAPEPV